MNDASTDGAGPAVDGPEYFILSLKWSRRRDQWLTFWRPDDKGYAWALEWAGRYTEAEVRALPRYYDNKRETVAVPCSVVEANAVPAYIDRASYTAVPFERERIQALRIAATRSRRKRTRARATEVSPTTLED